MARTIDLDIKQLPKKENDDALFPCPFCGSDNVTYATYQHECGRRWVVLCMNCMAEIDPGWAQSWEAVQQLWNRRSGEKKDG